MSAEPELTIDELAQRVGMTVRNVRAHQSRGLLPAPELRGRTGYYSQAHVDRLELIKDLQGEGFNLEAIRHIVQRRPASRLAEVVSFSRALAEPFTDEEPEIVDLEELRRRWGEQLTADVATHALRLGVARSLGEGRFELLSPRLERAGTELAGLGIELDTAVALSAELRKHCEAVARAYVRLFLDQVWRPFVAEGEPEERWEEVADAFARLRPLAAESVAGMFGIVMTEQVERAREREMARLGAEDPSPRRRRGRR